MTRVRLIVGASGLDLIGVGVVFLVLDLTVGEIAGLVVWLAAALVVHDGLLVPAVTTVDLLLRRTARRLPPAVVTVVEAGLAVGALLTAIVVPELVAQSLGPRNPTVLPGDYGIGLAVLWLLIAGGVVVTSAVIVWRARRSARKAS